MKRDWKAQVQRLIPEFLRNNLYIFPDKYEGKDYFQEFATLANAREILKTTKSKTAPEVLAYCKGLFEGEEDRQKLLENKAAIIAGFSGTIFAGVLAFNSGLFDANTFGQLPRGLQSLIAIAYGLIDLSLLNSIRCSLASLFIRKYNYPDPPSLLKRANQDLLEFQCELASRYCSSYATNYAVNSEKAHAFEVALKSFRAAIVLVALVILIFVASAAVNPVSPNSSPPIPSTTPSSTATVVVSPTNTSIPTYTSSPTMPSTPSPMRTITP